ncbi:MAG: hypothetical protein Kow0068_16840 [Marinilabiliales bacterium]
MVLINLADLQVTYADSVAKTQAEAYYYNEAIKNGLRGYKIAVENNIFPKISSASLILKEAYKKTGNYKKALEFAEIYISTQDTIFQKEKVKAIQEAEVKFQTEKKQIEKLESQKLLDNQTIALQNERNKKQQIIIYVIILFLLLVIVFLFILFRMFRQKRQANIILEQQKEEILAQRDEIESQRDLAAKQRD